MNDRLKVIVDEKRKRLAARKRTVPLEALKRAIAGRDDMRSLGDALSKKGGVRIIAEIKKASPSAGIIRRDLDPVTIAKRYASGGAAAISVLTEERYFKGDISFLAAVRAVASVPVLRKDFIFDPYQIYESAAFGADALLLIAALLDRRRLTALIELAGSLGLDCLVEVHTEKELEKVLRTPARIIGINNRNLKDLSVDAQRALSIALKVPKDRIAVIESGIKGKKDMEPYVRRGIRSFLIGETLMRSRNAGRTLKTLIRTGAGDPPHRRTTGRLQGKLMFTPENAFRRTDNCKTERP